MRVSSAIDAFLDPMGWSNKKDWESTLSKVCVCVLSIIFGILTLGIVHGLYALWARMHSTASSNSSDHSHRIYTPVHSSSSSSSSVDTGAGSSVGSVFKDNKSMDKAHNSFTPSPTNPGTYTCLGQRSGLEPFYQELEKCVTGMSNIAVFVHTLASRADNIIHAIEQYAKESSQMQQIWIIVINASDADAESCAYFRKMFSQQSSNLIPEENFIFVKIKESFALGSKTEVINHDEVFDSLRFLAQDV